MAEKDFNILTELDSIMQSDASDKTAQSLGSVLDNLHALRTTNLGILNYFRSAYYSDSEQIQSLKSQLFELDIKIEELEKTKEIYTFRSDTRRDIFSPQPSNNTTQNKGAQLQTQINELMEVRTSLDARIMRLEQDLYTIRHHMDALESSSGYINEAIEKLPSPEDITPAEPSSANENPAEEKPDTEQEQIAHACRILKLNQHDKTQIANYMQSSIHAELETQQNKIEVLKWLIQSDPNRAKLTVQEIQDTNSKLLERSSGLMEQLKQEEKKNVPTWLAIDETFKKYQKEHEDCSIDAKVDCADYNLKIDPIITITLLTLIREVMNNVFLYSNANKVLAKVYINNRMIDVYINDNGVGIPPDYLERSGGTGGLIRLHEIIHLLQGKVSVDGNIISGTNVRFSFPLPLEETQQTKVEEEE